MSPDGIASYRPSVSGVTHMVSSGHYLAAAAGYRVLEQGGNAVDAGVASGIAINVTLPHMTSFGGVAPIVIYVAETDEVVTISGLGRWPKAVSLELFLDTYGEIPPGIPRSVVPAACDAWLTALELYGTMSFEQVVTPALELAEKGFPASHRLAASIAVSATELGNSPEATAAFMPGGKPPAVGDTLRRTGLARVFRWMIDAERRAASEGRRPGVRAARDVFYRGEVAERMARFCQERGGYLTMDDFADFHVRVEPPETASYKDYDVYTCGAWCQGPSLLQVLNILEGVDLPALGHNSAAYVHTAVEAVKLAFADRDAYYGDPDFVDVPMEMLLSKEYAAARRELIDPDSAWPEMPPPGGAGVTRRVGLVVRGRRRRLGGRHELHLRRGRRRQRLLRHAERRRGGRAARARDRDGDIDPRVAELAGPESSVVAGAVEAAPADPEPRAGAARRPAVHAVRHARRGRAGAGHGAALPERRRVRDGPAAGHRGASLREHELPQLVLASRLPARCAGGRIADRRRRAVRAGRPGPHDRAVAGLGGADRRSVRHQSRPRRAVRRRRPAPGILRHRKVTAA